MKYFQVTEIWGKMSKDNWFEARENLLNNLVEDFKDKNKRYPTIKEEYELEMSITEDDLREAVSNYEA